MTAHPHHNSLNNPDPVMTPASNPHRVGASNHHKGSGEIPMVGKEPADHIARRMLFDALVAKASWFEAENAALRAENTKLLAELDAAREDVLNLIGELLETGRGGVRR